MIVVLIHWRIKPECKDEFLAYWSTKTVIDDRSGLIGEFMSEVENGRAKHLPWITWRIDPESLGDALHYVNVGLWTDEDKFQKQVGRYFNDDKPMQAFEKYRRRRMLLRPQLHRRGEAGIPSDPPSVR